MPVPVSVAVPASMPVLVVMLVFALMLMLVLVLVSFMVCIGQTQGKRGTGMVHKGKLGHTERTGRRYWG